MRIKQFLFQPSIKIADPRKRKRAQIAIVLLFVRQLTLVFMALGLAHVGEQRLVLPIMLTSVVNFIGYLIARTSRFQIGVLLVVSQPLIGVPLSLYLVSATSSEIVLSAPVWLLIGPLICGLTLPTRYTVSISCATVLVFVILAFEFDRRLLPGHISNSMSVLVAAFLACVGSYLRDSGEAELDLERARLSQAAKLASIGEMAAGVAHELNSPLAAIILNAELLEDELSNSGRSPEALQSAQEIIVVSERMATIIKSLKTYSRENGKLELEEVLTSKWIGATLDLCRERFQSQKIPIYIEDSTTAFSSLINSAQMSQVLLSLLNNSYDAIHRSTEKWVKISVRGDENTVEILVTDSGRGISDDMASRIFEPFYTTKDFGQGTGLGLSSAQGIVLSHGGSLIYNSTSPNTQFVIRLPLTRISLLQPNEQIAA